MSRSIHKPWIKELVAELLSSPLSDAIHTKLKTKRCVQILSCNEESRCITISDTDVCVQAFLTAECFQGLVEDYSMDTLKYGQVNLVNYCFSTVTQAAGNQDMKKLMTMNVSFPLVLHCFKIDYLGASDCNVIGSPQSLNASSRITALLRQYRYQQLKERLAIAQFPLLKSLPDWEGAFDAHETFSAERPLTRAAFAQPESQLRIIQALNSFDLCHVVNALPALLMDEGTSPDSAGTQATSSTSEAAQAEASSTQVASSVGQHDFTADGWTETIREDDGDYDAERVDWSTYWRPLAGTQVPSDGEESDPEGAMQDRDFPPASDEEDEGSKTSSGRVTRSTRRPFSTSDMEVLPHREEASSASGARGDARLDTGTQCTQDMTQASQLFSQLSAGASLSPLRTRGQRSASQHSAASSAANSTASSPVSSKGKDKSGSARASAAGGGSRRQGSSQGSTKTPLQSIPEESSPGGNTVDSLSLRSTQSLSQHTALQNRNLLELYQKLSQENWAAGQPVTATASSSAGAAALASAPALATSTSAAPLTWPVPAPLPARPVRQSTDPAWGSSTWTEDAASQSQSQAAFQSQLHGESLQASDESKATSGDSHSAGNGDAPGAEGGNWMSRPQPYITQDELGSLMQWGNEYASQFVFPLNPTEDTTHSAASATGDQSAAGADSVADGSSFVCVDVLSAADANALADSANSSGGEPISGITQDESPGLAPVTQANPSSALSGTPYRPSKPSAPSTQPQAQSESQQSSSYREPSAPTPIVMINDGVSGRNAAMKRGQPVELPVPPATTDAAVLREANALLNRSITRVFRDGSRYSGTIRSHEDGMFLVEFEDGERHELNLREVKKWLVPLAAVTARPDTHQGSTARDTADQESSADSQAEVLTAPQFASSSSSAHSVTSAQSGHSAVGSATHSSSGASSAHHAPRLPSPTPAPQTAALAPASSKSGRPPLGSSSARPHMSAAAALFYSQEDDRGAHSDDASVTSESLGLRNVSHGGTPAGHGARGQKRNATSAGVASSSDAAATASPHRAPSSSATKARSSLSPGGADGVNGVHDGRPHVALMSDEQLEQYCATLQIPEGMVVPPLSYYKYNYYNFLRHLPTLIEQTTAAAQAKVVSPTRSVDTSVRKTWNFRGARGPQHPVASGGHGGTSRGAAPQVVRAAEAGGAAGPSGSPSAPVPAAAPVDYANLSDAEIAQRFPRREDARHARMQRSIQQALLRA